STGAHLAMLSLTRRTACASIHNSNGKSCETHKAERLLNPSAAFDTEREIAPTLNRHNGNRARTNFSLQNQNSGRQPLQVAPSHYPALTVQTTLSLIRRDLLECLPTRTQDGVSIFGPKWRTEDHNLFFLIIAWSRV